MAAFRGEGWSRARRNHQLDRLYESHVIAPGVDARRRYVIGGRSGAVASDQLSTDPEFALNGSDVSLTDDGDGTLSATAAVITDDATVDVTFRSSSPGRITWPDGSETLFLGQETITQTVAVSAGDNVFAIVSGAIAITVTVIRVTLSVTSPTGREDDGTLTFTVTRSDGGSDVAFTAQTVDGTAVAGTDYTSTTETFTLTGSDTHAVVVPIANRAGAQGDRSFSVEVTA